MAFSCVFCASSLEIAPRYLDLATEVGAEPARRGHGLVSGGGTVSCMGAVADDDAGELIVTPDLRSRKGEMDRRSDAFLVLPGRLGTLEEMVESWASAVLSMRTLI